MRPKAAVLGEASVRSVPCIVLTALLIAAPSAPCVYQSTIEPFSEFGNLFRHAESLDPIGGWLEHAHARHLPYFV